MQIAGSLTTRKPARSGKSTSKRDRIRRAEREIYKNKLARSPGTKSLSIAQHCAELRKFRRQQGTKMHYWPNPGARGVENPLQATVWSESIKVTVNRKRNQAIALIDPMRRMRIHGPSPATAARFGNLALAVPDTRGQSRVHDHPLWERIAPLPIMKLFRFSPSAESHTVTGTCFIKRNC